MPWFVDEIDSPIGVITCVTKDDALVALEFEGNDERLRRLLAHRFGPVVLAAPRGASDVSRRIQAYFAGDWPAIESLPVALGGTPFERRVHAELRRIPRGQTISYTTLAQRVGAANAVRAVGAANAKNPISIVVPCHRVIGANGSLTGYAGGLERKRWLLEHEGAALKRA